MPPVRLVVADDHLLIREGLVRILGDLGFDVVAAAADAAALEREARRHLPDVVVADIRMPPGRDAGLRACDRLRRERPDLGVLFVSQHLEVDHAMDLLAADARGMGYLLKDRIAELRVLGDAVARVARGESVLDPEVVRRVVARRRHEEAIASLTPREHEVLEHMAAGRSNPGIAAALGVTSAAVEKHVTRIFAKLDLGPGPGDHHRVMAVLARLGAA